MSDKNGSETVADIVAELRDCPPPYAMPDCVAYIVARSLADRIEAAFVRNNDDYNCELTRLREALRGLLEIVCDDCKAWRGDSRKKCVGCPRVVAARDALKGGAK